MQLCQLIVVVTTIIGLLCCNQFAESFQCCNATTAQAHQCKCECNAVEKSVNCAKKQLQKIPIDEIDREVELLDLSNNELSSLNDLANLTKLTHLILSHNKISEWDSNWLEDLPVLQQLQLSQNQLKTPPVDLCDRLPRLQRLYLDNNHLDGSFPLNYSSCTHLSRLTLSNNKFKVIDNSTLCALGALKTSAPLSLKLNRLQQSVRVQPGALACLSIRLISLDIGQNFLNQSDIEALVGGSSLSRLQTLALKMSPGLHSVTKNLLGGLSDLQTLSLDGSPNLAELVADAFAATPKLKRLSLSRTKVAKWSAGSLDRLSSLHELDLRNTSVTTVGGSNGSDANPLPQLENSSLFANLSLMGAQLACDCSIYWLTRQLRNQAVVAKVAEAKRLTCAQPPETLGRRLMEFAPDNCDGQSPGFFTTKMIVILSSAAGGLVVTTVIVVLAIVACRRGRGHGLRAAASSDMEDPLVTSARLPGDDASSTASTGRRDESGWICLELRRFVRQSRETMAYGQEPPRRSIYNPPEPESYLTQDPASA